MNCKQIEACRLCGGPVEKVFDLGEMALTGVFPKPGVTVPKSPLALALCGGDCGLVQLTHSCPPDVMYGASYGYRSGLNPSMVRHLQNTAHDLRKIVYPNRGDVILDIGSNDGTLLDAMPDTATRIGVDPSAEKFADYYPPAVTRIADFFPNRELEAVLGTRKAKIITSIAMFYDLEQPLAFAHEIARILADDGVWHTEQSYLPQMLAKNAYDTICQEHLEYYSITQLQWIAERAGLKIIALSFNQINGGSFAVTFALKDAPYAEAPTLQKWLREEKSFGLCQRFTYEQFKVHIDRQRDALLRTLAALERRPWGYGASTKGNVLLQYCGLGRGHIEAVYDVNPDKEGCITSTGIPIAITPPEDPVTYLVLPWHFKADILSREKAALAAGFEFLFPLPNVEVARAK